MIAVIFAAVGAIWLGALVFLGLLGLYVARKRYDGSSLQSSSFSPSQDSISFRDSTNNATCPGVTILRPLRGLDTNLYENLEASFLQKYAYYEIIFSVADEDDAAISIVKDLMEKYPKVTAKLIIGEEIVGVNPKINNLIRSYRAAAHDILWVLDSNVLTSQYTLANSVALLTAPAANSSAKPIGLVHHLPFATYPDTSLGSRVEQTFLCTTHAKMYLAINYLAVASCVMGKSCLYRKSDLERAAAKKRETGKGMKLAEKEGLAAFGKYLGEDNMIGEAIWDDLGMRHAMGGDIAGNAVGQMKFSTFFRRRVRWIRVRKYMVVASTLVEPFTECFVSAIVAAFTFSYYFGLPKFVTIPTHVILWYWLDVAIYKALLRASPAASTRLRPPAHDGPGLPFLRAWLVREVMALPIWVFAMGGNTVGWRDDGKMYRVKTDGSVDLHGRNDGLGERLLRSAKSLWGEKTYITIRPDDEESARLRS